MFLATTKSSIAWDLIELGDISAINRHYFSNATDNMPNNYAPSTSLGLNINIVLLNNLYFNSAFQGISDKEALRTFGWEYELGAKVTDWLHVGYSRDRVYPIGVQQDGWLEHEVFIKIKLYEGVKPSSIW